MKMNTKLKISLKALLISAMVMILLVGCSGQKSSSTPDSSSVNTETSKTEKPASQDGSSEFPIVIKHAFGETEIASKPERVVTVQWANHDVVLALGVVPVGFSAANYGVQDDSGLLPWTAKNSRNSAQMNPISSRIPMVLILRLFQMQTLM